jgi:hypothetical protein
MRRALSLVTVVAGGVALALALLWLARPGHRRRPESPTPTPARVRAAGAAAPRAPIPVFAGDPLVAAVAPATPVMSEGLAADLKMFDSTQLRAELESIATSYPEVILGAVACSARPCTAEASSGDAEQLNGFVQMVSNRFQGHLRTRWSRRLRAGRAIIEARFLIGGQSR